MPPEIAMLTGAMESASWVVLLFKSQRSQMTGWKAGVEPIDVVGDCKKP